MLSIFIIFVAWGRQYTGKLQDAYFNGIFIGVALMLCHIWSISLSEQIKKEKSEKTYAS